MGHQTDLKSVLNYPASWTDFYVSSEQDEDRQ